MSSRHGDEGGGGRRVCQGAVLGVAGCGRERGREWQGHVWVPAAMSGEVMVVAGAGCGSKGLQGAGAASWWVLQLWVGGR